MIDMPTLTEAAVAAGGVALVTAAHWSRHHYEPQPGDATFDPVPAGWVAVVPLDCDSCHRPHTPHEVTGDNTARCVTCGHTTTPEVRHG